ncbi:hypothetical protein UlMin_013212 [Ulmus minor]
MEGVWRAVTGQDPSPDEYSDVEFWSEPERAGWLTKQGEYIKTWRRRWFVLKQGKIFWFKDSNINRASTPRGVINLGNCLTIKGAEDVVHKPCAFELSGTSQEPMFFVADTDKDKEDWINSIGRAIVQNSRSLADSEVVDYDARR